LTDELQHLSNAERAELLQRGIERAILDDEFADKLSDPAIRVSPDELREHLRNSSDRIWETVPDRVGHHDAKAARGVLWTRWIGPSVVNGLVALLLGLAASGLGSAGPFDALPAWALWALGGVGLASAATSAVAARAAMRRSGELATRSREALESRLYIEGIKPIARDLFPQESWELTMHPAPTPGLGELTNPRFEVATESRDTLVALIKDLRGGAIGVAGPRGAGKTTLIDAVCSGRTDATPAEYVGVQVTAPVSYAANDFITHLITETCVAVIDDQARLDQLRRKALQRLTGRSRMGTAVALLLLALVFGLAAFLTTETTALTAGERALVVLAGLAFVCFVVAYSLVMLEMVGDVYARLETIQTEQVRSRLARAYVHFMKRGLAVVLGLSGRSPTGRDVVAERALDLYQQAKFQQTLSSGFAGSMKLPLGFGLSADSKVSWAQVQLTLPEMVELLRDFLGFIVAQERGPVIIGIDELDKIQSSEDARAFLNGIKSIFGVPGVYFLVSVSQDAMSSFERRGLPFRDVFDSSFDEIVGTRHPCSRRRSTFCAVG
jgi:hypothetical protein